MSIHLMSKIKKISLPSIIKAAQKTDLIQCKSELPTEF